MQYISMIFDELLGEHDLCGVLKQVEQGEGAKGCEGKTALGR
jgi:hypothetical protein